MKIIGHQLNGKNIATVNGEAPIVKDVESAIDLIGNLYYLGYDALVLHEADFVPDFFVLKTTLAGEVLQKFSNYRMRLAIVGDWSAVHSISLRHFIRESNAGKIVFFANSEQEAITRLAEL